MDYLLNKKCRNTIWVHRDPQMAVNSFQIIGIGCPDWMKPSMIDRQRGTDDYLFIFFPTQIYVRHERKIQLFPEGTFFLWTPGHRHNFGHPDQPWCHLWMHIQGTVVERLLTNSTLPVNVPLILPEWTVVEDGLRAIYDELNDHIEADSTILGALLTLLVRKLARSLQHDTNVGRIPERVARIMKLMSTRPADCPERIIDLAAKAGLSSSHFCAEFRVAFGISPIRFLIDKKLELAARMLRDRNLRIAEISSSVGFRDPFYFSRQFRIRYGKSPRQYRDAVNGHY